MKQSMFGVGGLCALGVLPFVAMSALVACSGADEAVGVQQDGLLHCGFTQFDLASAGTQQREILYYADGLTREIAEKGLTAKLGFERVSACAQAELATAAIQEFVAAQPPLDNLETGEAVDDPLETEPGEKIANAIGTGFLPGLELGIGSPTGICTGALINPRVAVTAGHCVTNVVAPNGTDRTQVNADVALNLFRPAAPGAFASWTCAHTGELFTKCTTTQKANITIKGTFTGAGDSDDDLAIIWLPSGQQFNSVATSDLLRVYIGSFNSFSEFLTHGRGPDNDLGQNSGVMRYASFGLDSFGDFTFTSNVRTPRTCSGDSGGYATVHNCLASNPASCGDHLIGLHVASTRTSAADDQCANSPGVQVGVRMAGGSTSKINWIKSITGISCSNIAGTLGTYARCW